MPVHKKVAKAVKKVGKKAVRKALRFVGVRTRKPLKRRMRAAITKKLRRRRPLADRLPGQIGIRRKVGLRDAGRPIKPKKQVGPPKVGMRTIKGRGGKRITIKRPRPRIV